MNPTLTKTRKTCAGMTAASLIAWLLLLPPFSVTPAGKTLVDPGAPLLGWEVFSQHSTEAQCVKHRDELRAQLAKAAASNNAAGSEAAEKKSGNKASPKIQELFATLKQRAAAARCVDSNDPRLRKPSPSPSPKQKS